MIVLGADVHKHSHTLVAVSAQTGEIRGEYTIEASAAGFVALLERANALDADRVFAVEDCRHVSGALERHLLANGEQVVRVPPARAHGARRHDRRRGTSDAIDAAAIARAALREGCDRLPRALTDEQALEVRLLVDHHDDLIAQRGADQARLRWHLHELVPELSIPAGGLDRERHLRRVEAALDQAPDTTRTRIARAKLRAIRAATGQISELVRELDARTRARWPVLRAERGVGPLIGARIIAQVGAIERFDSDAQIARLGGVAPIPASSGRTDRHRLDCGGDRRLNCALHRLAVIKGRLCPETSAYLAKKQAEGKTRMDALRCLKRHLARRVFRLLSADAAASPAGSFGALATPELT